MVELSNIQQTARLFKALGNEQRLRLFLMVHRMGTEGGTVSATDITGGMGEGCCAPVKKAFSAACECLGLAPSTVSHHMKALQDAGLITCTRNGQSYVCQVNEAALDAVRRFLR